MLKLDEDEVLRRLKTNNGPIQHTDPTRQVAREQVIRELRLLDCGIYSDPQVERLVEILRFAFEHGVL